MNFSLFKETRSPPLMTISSIHRTHLADNFSIIRGMGLLGILVSMTLFFSKGIYAAGPVNELKSLQTLSFEASGCAPEILRAICSALKEEDKDLKINLQNDAPMLEYARIHGYLLYSGKYQKVRSLNLSNMDIDDLPAFIFEHMTNLESLNLSGDANLNLNSEVFKSLCQQLIVLDVSNCNIDESDFSTICSNCPKLKILRVSGNPRINFAEQEMGFKDTLEELKVDNCDLDTEDMLTIAEFKSLERLDISNNWLKEYFGKFDLGDLKNTLTELKASKVGMTSENLYKITECSKITVLDISHNNLEKIGSVYGTYTDIFRNIILYALSYFVRTEDAFLGDLTDRLTSLNVSRANLNTGQLKEILDSPSIETLDCSCNDFSRIGWTFRIGRAKSVLKNAKFSNCYIESPKLLEGILNCSSLTKLDVSKNSFNMPYNKLTFGSSVGSLKWLDISESEINVRLFIEILGKSEIIEYLDISGKSLPTLLLQNFDHRPIQFDSSKAVSTIGGLKKSLKTFKASNCKLENDYSLLHSLTSCERLEYLDISRNDLSRLPADFQFGSSRKTLKCLNMNNCGTIRIDIFKAVTDLKVLEVLNMDFNKYEITQEHFELGVSKNSLKEISMRDSSDSFNLTILRAISECRVLETLDLSWSYMENFELENFGAARLSLRKINMDYCGISSEVLLRAVLDCEKVEELSLNGNNLSNLSEDFKVGNSKHSLKVLEMSYCQLRGQNILFEITDCSNLKELNLNSNNFRNISGDFSFGSSRHSLKALRMDQCEITNQFTAINSCEMLETLSISCNSFSSYNFGKSRNTLKDLDISGNRFSGIKDFNNIFDCKRLEKLDISYIPLGQFEQELNSEIFNMPGLKELVATECGLTKPSSLRILTSFPKLEKINISTNRFCSLPDGFSLGISKDTLTKITAESYNFSDRHIIKALTDCGRLEVLTLRENREFEKCGKVAFGSSTNSLKELYLGSCDINLLNWIDEIKKCTKIQKLDLSFNDLSKVTDEFDYDGFRDSISYLKIDRCKTKGTKILSSLAKYQRLEHLMMIGWDLQGIDQNFKFDNLTYTLENFRLNGCENFDPNDRQKILGLFKFLERQ